MTGSKPSCHLIPSSLKQIAIDSYQKIKTSCQLSGIDFTFDPLFEEQLLRVGACSEFVVECLTQQPGLLQDFAASGDLNKRLSRAQLDKSLSKKINNTQSQSIESFYSVIRQFRHQQLVRIAWRNLLELSDLIELMNELSWVAEVSIEKSLEFIYQHNNIEKNYQHLLIIAVGKLGGQELNFSSDVDLMFAYPNRLPVDAEQVLTQVGQQLIKALSEVTEDGFAFRVDMRLRPFGESGPLVMNLAAMENYYQDHGRDWERYALIKARVITGEKKDKIALMKMLRPFIYRRYIDYGVFESLREMKALIEKEIQLQRRLDDIKVGKGGIRQIEFIGQAFQLVRGGKEPIFQERQIIKVITLLGEKKILPLATCNKLIASYCFLRNTEHRIQMLRDQQQHLLPEDSIDKMKVAFGLGFSHWDHYWEALSFHRNTVTNLFELISAGPARDCMQKMAADQGVGARLIPIWDERCTETEALVLLQQAGFLDANNIYDAIKHFKRDFYNRRLSQRGRKRFDNLLPMLFACAINSPNPDHGFLYLLQLIEAIGRRSAYLALLIENPFIIEQLVQFALSSSWIAKQICEFPALLDELLPNNQSPMTLSREQLQEELANRLRWLQGDLEAQMEAFREFKMSNLLQIAIADVTGTLATKRVSDFLTEIAEVILQSVVQIVWQLLVERHGVPQSAPGVEGDCEFAVLAYGKLGGFELGYVSDLDLVFLYDCQDFDLPTVGEHAIPTGEFYLRFGQRVFQILNAKTLSGVLYPIDMRLRPLGGSGSLVHSMDAFREYQRQDAWTWEHQALVRARIIVGSQRLRQQFDSFRREIIGRKRNPDELRKSIQDMRQKMMEAKLRPKSSITAETFNLKVDSGGIEDIEFIVQYGVLRWGALHPLLLEHTDNLRLLNSLSVVGVITSEEKEALCEAYIAYRARAHHLSLHNEPAEADLQSFQGFRMKIIDIWQKMFGV